MNEVLLIAIPAAGFTSTVIALACCVAAGRADKNLRPLDRTQEGTGAGAATVRGRRAPFGSPPRSPQAGRRSQFPSAAGSGGSRRTHNP